MYKAFSRKKLFEENFTISKNTFYINSGYTRKHTNKLCNNN